MLSQLLRKAKEKNLVIPNVKQAGSEQGKYEGATVSQHLHCLVFNFFFFYPGLYLLFTCIAMNLIDSERLQMCEGGKLNIEFLAN